MIHERQNLQTFVTNLLPPTHSVRVTEVTIEQEYVCLQLTTTAPTACCPCCTMPSSSVHSRYQRHLTDLPWGTRAVRIQLMVRKFVCRNPSCARRIFTERLPELIATYARKTHRLAPGRKPSSSAATPRASPHTQRSIGCMPEACRSPSSPESSASAARPCIPTCVKTRHLVRNGRSSGGRLRC